MIDSMIGRYQGFRALGALVIAGGEWVVTRMRGRAIARGRKNYLFVGSEAGGKAAAIAYTLIETAKLNGVDPNAWLADILARIPDYKITKVDDLLPWHWNG